MIHRLMQHDVVPIKVTVDNFGNPDKEELPTEKGFFEYRERNTFDRDGNMIRSRGILFLKADSQFTTSHEKWEFRDVKNDRQLQAENSNVIDDPRTGETHHYEIELR